MSQKTLHIAYDGPALDTHEMDVRELAPALLAFSDMFEEANAVLNGDRAKISLNVKGSFKTGSLGAQKKTPTTDSSICRFLLTFDTSIGLCRHHPQGVIVGCNRK
ncbi:MAG: hypothetical protein E7022_01495 [Desulfovibrio desulfuricans]|nr:hypothetical protein [Desulfovibrio desulfuricans]